ncbi:unnamed protein product [Hyaloperonospora brassicae]|uniref:Elicitor-like transglutaminase n=1 Tax=Hyaloperonospora brassicae TaxID=162125 RepID=A0AAV0T2N4_HYABA|nr:unnamed protein product [Hyaloperonospora brassicae]
MGHWKLACGLAAVYVGRHVTARPINEDITDVPDEFVELDETFPGSGAFLPKDAAPTPTTFDTRGRSGNAVQEPPAALYDPGSLHAPSVARRRLEGTMTRDMEKLEQFFGLELVTDITKLPTKYEHHPIPWPGSYWPTYADSINYQWDKKQPSPAEKYATAFGHDVATMMDKISMKSGIDKHKNRKKCKHQRDCRVLKDTSVCAKRHGHKMGYCIPKWFGICHAWAPAAILEPEPRCVVEHNGTTFEPYDIKALITMAYHGSKIPTIFTGSRFNGNDATSNITDKFGRFTDERRRDISPGFFHIATTNIMGRFNSSFVIDMTAGSEVWNQPVRGYEIVRLAWVTPEAAAKRYFNVDKYPFNDAATKIAVVTTRVYWVSESGENGPLVSTGRVDKFTTKVDYEYVLETDETYQILGGEWLSGSKATHIDFMWIPASKPDLSTTTSLGMVYAEVEELILESARADCKSPPAKDKKPKPDTGDSETSDASSSGPASDDGPSGDAEASGSAPDGSSDDDEAPGPAPGGSANNPVPRPGSRGSSKSGSGDSPAPTPGRPPAPAPGGDAPEAPPVEPEDASGGDAPEAPPDESEDASGGDASGRVPAGAPAASRPSS